MDDSDVDSSRSPKRRRITRDVDIRDSSPDELAASSDREAQFVKHANNNIRRQPTEQRRLSYDFSVSEESPDELDHTVHAFYRNSAPRSRSIASTTPSHGASSSVSRARTPLKQSEGYIKYKQRAVLRGHRRGVAAVKFSPDGRFIASCCK